MLSFVKRLQATAKACIFVFENNNQLSRDHIMIIGPSFQLLKTEESFHKV